MFKILVDTCVWLDLAKDVKQQSLLTVIEDLHQLGQLRAVERVVPKRFLISSTHGSKWLDPVATAPGSVPTPYLHRSDKDYDDKVHCFAFAGFIHFGSRIFGVSTEKEKHCGLDHPRRDRSNNGWHAPGN